MTQIYQVLKKEEKMFKLIRPLAVAISVLTLMVLVLTACVSNQATQLTSTPTKAAASPAAAQATPTTAKAAPSTAAAKPAATPAPTKVMTTTAETKTTPAAPKATPASLKPVEAAPEAFMATLTTDKTLGDILTDDKGMTLYTFKNDKPNESTCDAACAQAWPPILVKDEQAKLELPKEATGKLGVIERKDGGYQITYNEMPLYRYAEDTKPGDVKGENVKELWHTVSLSASGMTEPTMAGGKIALLLPESKTTRYETADRPYFEAKFKELCPDCEIIYNNANQDATTQLSQAEAALTNGAQVMVLDPVDSAAASVIADKAKAQGVPVIAYDRLILNSNGVNYYISFDNKKVGELQAQSLVDELNKLGKKDPQIVMINGSPTDNNAKLFKEGAHSVFDPLVKAKKLTIAKEYDTPDWSPDQAQNEMQQALTALGNKVDGVYAANDGTASGTIAAMKAAGLKTLPPVTGQDAELAAVQRILEGEQYMTVYKAIKPEAEAAAQLAYDLLTKAQVPASMTAGQTVNNGKLDVPSVLLTPVAVTKSNINDTIVKDNFWTTTQICTSEYAKACTEAGLK
jgi:D-xylose transport system substrate-binding protein